MQFRTKILRGACCPFPDAGTRDRTRSIDSPPAESPSGPNVMLHYLRQQVRGSPSASSCFGLGKHEPSRIWSTGFTSKGRAGFFALAVLVVTYLRFCPACRVRVPSGVKLSAPPRTRAHESANWDWSEGNGRKTPPLARKYGAGICCLMSTLAVYPEGRKNTTGQYFFGPFYEHLVFICM